MTPSFPTVLLGALVAGLVMLSGSAAAAADLAAAEIAAMIDAARPGQTVRVPAGTYRGPLVLSKPVELVGEPGAVIDGGGKGTVVEIAAPDVSLRGFTIRGGGDSIDLEDAGVRVLAPRATIEGNTVEDVLFGVDLRESSGSVIRGNVIAGKDLDIARRGDAIRLWYSHDALVEENRVRDSRDVVMWYSEGVTLRRNSIVRGRYGLHTMYTHRVTLEENTLAGNSVGVYIMYSTRVTLRRNAFEHNRGPSGYGLGLKDADAITCEDNLFAGNRVGVYIDNSPFSLDSVGEFTRNVIAFNDQGMAMTPNTRNNEFWDNAFLENQEQVALLGRGSLDANRFARAGRGNYWSDYGGYDRDRDGVGDLPYRAASLFENLMDREPKLRVFLHSPVEQGVELAARAMPEMRPEPKFTDPAPLTSLPMSAAPVPPRAGSGPIAALGFGAVALGVGAMLLSRPRLTPPGANRRATP